MKLCTRCQQPSEQFALHAKSPDGLQAWCKPCVKEVSAKRYQDKKELRNAQNRANAERGRQRLREHKKTLRCVDCGNSDYRVLDFDHLDGKIGNIADLVNKWSWKRLLTEIEKCEVVCANCHRIRTLDRLSHEEDGNLLRSDRRETAFDSQVTD